MIKWSIHDAVIEYFIFMYLSHKPNCMNCLFAYASTKISVSCLCWTDRWALVTCFLHLFVQHKHETDIFVIPICISVCIYWQSYRVRIVRGSYSLDNRSLMLICLFFTYSAFTLSSCNRMLYVKHHLLWVRLHQYKSYSVCKWLSGAYMML